MRLAPTSDLWWKNAVVYCLDVETFHHDFDGLIDHIDHVADLGATCIWLMPFYPTPNQDDGYDISDYLGVDPRLGDLGDVLEAIRHAHDRGLRVLADLVVNHTSIQHPWFQAARADADSPYRAYYVWSDDPSQEKGTTPDNWTFDDAAGRYYMHRFQPFQPDLDITNPEVRHADRQDRRLLAAAGRLGLPHGRRAVHGARPSAPTRPAPTSPAAGCTRCASSRCAGAATRC